MRPGKKRGLLVMFGDDTWDSIATEKCFPESSHILDVAVYLLWVRKQRKAWPEQKERTRIWATLEDAAKLVREPGLKRLFTELEDEAREASRELQQKKSSVT